MQNIKNKTKLLKTLLQDKINPYKEMSWTISEQFVLLAMTARKLYLNVEYKEWFLKYDLLAKALVKEEALLNKLVTEEKNHNREIAYSSSVCSYDIALKVLSKIFSQQDKMTCIKCLHETRNYYSSFGNVNQHRNTSYETWLKILDLLENEVQMGFPKSIPLEARLGYRHHNLFVSLKYFEELSQNLELLSHIDTEMIISESIYYYSKINEDYQFINDDLRKTISANYIGEFVPTDNIKNDLKGIVAKVLNSIANDNNLIVIHLLKTIEESFSWYISMQVKDIFMPFIDTNTYVDFDWTIKSNQPDSRNRFKTSPFDCHIAIERTELLNLIQNNNLKHALFVLEDCLRSIYSKAEPLQYNCDIPEGESGSRSSKQMGNKFSLRTDNHECFKKLYLWGQSNSVLFVNDRKKLSMQSIFDAINCYDMKMGIFKDKETLLDAATLISKKCSNEPDNQRGTSVTTIKRNYSKIKKTIAGVDIMVKEQKKKNDDFTYSEAGQILKPLWDNI